METESPYEFIQDIIENDYELWKAFKNKFPTAAHATHQAYLTKGPILPTSNNATYEPTSGCCSHTKLRMCGYKQFACVLCPTK